MYSFEKGFIFFYRVAENGDFVNFTSFVFLINISVLLASVMPSELLLGRIVILSWPIAVSTSLTSFTSFTSSTSFIYACVVVVIIGKGVRVS